MEKTLVIIKPDGVQRGLVGEVIQRFEKVGLKIVGMKMVYPSKEHYHKHYEDIGKMISRRGKDVFDITLDYVLAGPVVAIVLEGISSVSLVRKITGETEPHKSAPGTIRGDYAHMTFKHSNDTNKGLPNIIHASGSKEEAEEEIYHWFNDEELFEYKTVHEIYTHGVTEKKPKSKK